MGSQLITVLGASGLLGTAVIREFADRPVRLRLVSRTPPTVPEGCRADIEVCTVDLTEPGAVARVVEGADTVIHLIFHSVSKGSWRKAQVDEWAERVNVGLVRDVLDAIRVQRPERPPVLLFAGSMSQSVRDPQAAEDVQVTVHDEHKEAAWQHILEAHEEGVVRGCSLQLATLYSHSPGGRTEDRSVAKKMIRQALADQPLTMWFEGAPKRDLLSVDDAARAFTAALESIDRTEGQYWQVGRGDETTIRELFTLISRVVSEHTGRPPVPVVSVSAEEYAVTTDRLDFVLDPTPFQEAGGWSAKVTLEEGIRLATKAIADSPTRHETREH